MICIVPLAGPDFWNEQLQVVKPLMSYDGGLLVEKAIKSRFWYQTGELKDADIIFVLRETRHTEECKNKLEEMFTGCKFVILSGMTRGALMSSLAAISMISDFNNPVCVDLVDIFFSSERRFNIQHFFEINKNYGGIVPYFEGSSDAKYSYLKLMNDDVLQIVEKRVISNAASTGTYIYKDVPTFLQTVTETTQFDELYGVNGNLFLSPSFNHIVRERRQVKAMKVKLTQCVSTWIKQFE
jgi:hypothetical protein